MATTTQPATLEEIVNAGGGKLIRIASGMVAFVDPETGSTLLLPIMLATTKRVSQSIQEHRRKRACNDR
jgi:hypothetical protein